MASGIKVEMIKKILEIYERLFRDEGENVERIRNLVDNSGDRILESKSMMHISVSGFIVYSDRNEKKN